MNTHGISQADLVPFVLDKPLTELFILGYRCQLEKLQKDMKAAAEAKAQKEREKRAAEQQDSEE